MPISYHVNPLLHVKYSHWEISDQAGRASLLYSLLIMTDTLLSLEQLLTDIENELRGMGMWESTAPPAEALMSQVPFCYDTLQFPQWLQWVFIPRCRMIVRGRAGIPAVSDIRSMAEIYLDEARIEAPGLLALMKRFDAMILQWNSPEGSPH